MATNEAKFERDLMQLLKDNGINVPANCESFEVFVRRGDRVRVGYDFRLGE